MSNNTISNDILQSAHPLGAPIGPEGFTVRETDDGHWVVVDTRRLEFGNWVLNLRQPNVTLRAVPVDGSFTIDRRALSPVWRFLQRGKGDHEVTVMFGTAADGRTVCLCAHQVEDPDVECDGWTTCLARLMLEIRAITPHLQFCF